MPENRLQGCNAHPGCQYPHCYCQVDRPPMTNQFRAKVDVVARELQRVSVALGQFKDDLKDVELENEILLNGMRALIQKYAENGHTTDNVTLQLVYSNIIKDIESVISVSQHSAADIYFKTQKSKS